MKKIIFSFLIIGALLVMGTLAYAHSGRTNRFGIHTVRTPGPDRIVGTTHWHPRY